MVIHLHKCCKHGVDWDDPSYCRACIDEPQQDDNEMTKEYIPTVAVDFDGVIHSYTSGWKGAHVIPDPPVPGAIEFLAHFCEDSVKANVVIFSSRAKTFRGRWAIRDWLRTYSGSYWQENWQCQGIESIKVTAVKPAAVVYIDDRAQRFEGTFPELTRKSIEALLNRKPWNK